MRSYRVEEHEHGLLVYGPLPIADMRDVVERAKDLGFTIMEMRVTARYRRDGHDVSMAITSKGHARKWHKELDAALPSNLSPLKRWLAQGHGGRSALTMLHGTLNLRQAKEWCRDIPAIPSDAHDFRSCLKVCEIVPAIKDCFPGLVERYPVWEPIVEHWDELEAVADDYTACTDLLKEIRCDA